MHDWHKSLLHQVVPPLIKKWESKLRVEVAGYFLQRMKTKWGQLQSRARHIRLNTELVKKPRIYLNMSSCTRWHTFLHHSQRAIHRDSAKKLSDVARSSRRIE